VTIQRGKAQVIEIKEVQRGGRPVTIQRGKAQAIEIKKVQSGRIDDNTEKERHRLYRDQESTKREDR